MPVCFLLNDLDDDGLITPTSLHERAHVTVWLPIYQPTTTFHIQNTNPTTNHTKPPPTPWTDDTVGYHASTSNHISAAPHDEVSYAKLPYPVPFKTVQDHQQNHFQTHHEIEQHQNHNYQSPSHQSGSTSSVSLDSQLPVNVGGQSAYDFISSYDAPASGLGNAFAGSAAPTSSSSSFNLDSLSGKGHPASAVETLREILNKNIPYTDQHLHQQHLNNQANIDVQYSDQGLGNDGHLQLPTSNNQLQEHDTGLHTSYGAPPSGSFDSSSSLGHSSDSSSSSFSLNNDHNSFNSFNTLPSYGHNEPPQQNHHHNHEPHNANTHQPGADSNPVQQYEIPPDPQTYVPAFKPLSKVVVSPQPFYGRYGAPGSSYGLPPVQTVYQSHSVHAAYGPPALPPPARLYRPAGTNNNKHGNHGGSGGFGGFGGLGPVQQGPPSNYKGNTYLPPSAPHQTYGPGPNRRTHFVNPHNNNQHFNLHGKRSNGFLAKNGVRGNNFGIARNGGAGPLQGQAPPKLPPMNFMKAPAASQPIVVADLQPEHEKQVQEQLQQSLGSGLDIEVQKSIQIELDSQGNVKETPAEASASKASPDSAPVSTPIRRSSGNGDNDLIGQTPVASSLPSAPTVLSYSRPYSRQRQTPKKYTFHRF